jgi:predicted nucleic acid-binding Zn finger protein
VPFLTFLSEVTNEVTNEIVNLCDCFIHVELNHQYVFNQINWCTCTIHIIHVEVSNFYLLITSCL